MAKEEDWQQYSKPPITEAAIEFRLAAAWSQLKVDKAAKKLGKFYELSDEEHISEFRVNPKTGIVEGGKTDWLGRKLSSADRADILAIRKSSVIFSRLAPYQGWRDFLERVKRDWGVCLKVAGSSPIVRVGLRYINRLDIPAGPEGMVNIDNYLNVGPKFPDIGAQPITLFSMQVQRPLATDQLNLILNTGTVVPPPLIGYASLALDIDLSRTSELPRSESDLWTLLETMRSHKNRIFETCITPASRILFS